MANTQKYLNHLLQNTGITPACSEEERVAADLVADIFKNHGLEPEIQEFSATNGVKTAYAVLGVTMAIGAVLSGFEGIIGFIGLVLCVISAALFFLERGGRPVLSVLGKSGLSQNVIACHKAEGPLASPHNRPVVILAHYDSPRADLFSQPAVAPYRPAIVKLLPVMMAVPPVVAVACLLPIPGAAKIVLWVISILCSLVPLFYAVNIIASRVFMPYTSGAVCNKSGVAAMLGVMDAVAPAQEPEFEDDIPFEEYMAGQHRIADDMAAEAEARRAARRQVPSFREDEEPSVEEPAPSADRPMFMDTDIFAPIASDAEGASAPQAPVDAEATVAMTSEQIVEAAPEAAPETGAPSEGRVVVMPKIVNEEPAPSMAAESCASVPPARPEAPAAAVPAPEPKRSRINSVGNIRYGADVIRALGMISSDCEFVYEPDAQAVSPVPATPAAPAVVPVVSAAPAAVSAPAPNRTGVFSVVDAQGEEVDPEATVAMSGEEILTAIHDEVPAMSAERTRPDTSFVGRIDTGLFVEPALPKDEEDGEGHVPQAPAYVPPAPAEPDPIEVFKASNTKTDYIYAAEFEILPEPEPEPEPEVGPIANSAAEDAVASEGAAEGDSAQDESAEDGSASDSQGTDSSVESGFDIDDLADGDVDADADVYPGVDQKAAPEADGETASAASPEDAVASLASDGMGSSASATVSMPALDVANVPDPSEPADPEEAFDGAKTNVFSAIDENETAVFAAVRDEDADMPRPERIDTESVTAHSEDDGSDEGRIDPFVYVPDRLEFEESLDIDEEEDARGFVQTLKDKIHSFLSSFRKESSAPVVDEDESDSSAHDAEVVVDEDDADSHDAEGVVLNDELELGAAGCEEPAPEDTEQVDGSLEAKVEEGPQIDEEVVLDAESSVAEVPDAHADADDDDADSDMDSDMDSDADCPPANAGSLAEDREPVSEDGEAERSAQQPTAARISIPEIEPRPVPEDASIDMEPGHTQAMPVVEPAPRRADTVDSLMEQINRVVPRVRTTVNPMQVRGGDRQIPSMPSTEPSSSDRGAIRDIPDPSSDPASARVEEGRVSEPLPEEKATVSHESDVPAQVISTASKKQAAPSHKAKKEKRGLGKLFGRKKEDRGSMSDWLGVDDDFDAKRDGHEIGSWDNFEDDDWKGGAAGVSGVTDEELRDAITDHGYDELRGHDIWFVATGASEYGHAGADVFLDEHREFLRGVFVINLDSVGAGQLAMISSEGEHKKHAADRRILNLVRQVSSSFHHEIGAIDMPFLETDAYSPMKRSLRALTIAGVDGNRLACSHTAEDQAYNLDDGNVARVADVVAEVIRRAQ